MPAKEHEAAIVQLVQELRVALSQPLPNDSLPLVGPSVTSLLRFNPAAVRTIAYKKLHAFPFHEVPECWRRAFEDACLWEVASLLDDGDSTFNDGAHSDASLDAHQQDYIGLIVRLCDSAIIFTGAPGRRDLIDMILRRFSVPSPLVPLDRRSAGRKPTGCPGGSAKRRRLESYDIQTGQVCHIPFSFQCAKPSGVQSQPVVHKQHALERISSPSLAHFGRHMMSNAGPIILTEALLRWEAMDRWQSPQYWLDQTHDGRRLVPVELGRTYTDEGWGQKIMTFREYLTQYLLSVKLSKSLVGVEIAGSKSDVEGGIDPCMTEARIGYLAQHDLLTQIPALRNDILVPDYCFLPTPRSWAKSSPSHSPDVPARDTAHHSDSEDSDAEPTDPQLNIWLGPGGTVSPAHTDPHENMLCQVVGRKYVRLFPPSDGDKMYPMGSHESATVNSKGASIKDSNEAVDMQNTSRVDVGAFVFWSSEEDSKSAVAQRRRQEQLGLFPDHKNARYREGILEAGECLYIPRGWWHYIESLEGVSCSVSFWWD